MSNRTTWMKLTPQEKLEYGFWVVTATLSAVIAFLVMFIVKKENEYSTLQTDVQKKIKVAVSMARYNDSIEINRLKNSDNEKYQRIMKVFDEKEQFFKAAIQKLEQKQDAQKKN